MKYQRNRPKIKINKKHLSNLPKTHPMKRKFQNYSENIPASEGKMAEMKYKLLRKIR